jgi:uncharacterized lipoprotein YddW (UPF0748 family)
MAASYEPATLTPPKVEREFRGAWVATVGNIDWPSKKDLSTAEQKAELIAILDQAAKLKMNAIIFQVRPACDALYVSKIEPWSEYLTGEQGKAPQPLYDPLAFVITEAHRRGLELHAWFNPYRARHSNAKSPPAANHISKTKPQLVRKYGEYEWLDPGEKEVQDYSLSVVMDVVKRYDVDGIHFDDYFYPYPSEGRGGKELPFPDDVSWKKYGANGKLDRDDWRRENVNTFIRRTYDSIKAAKPWVKFGVSPFGIWRPKNPPQINGFDAYGQLYADSRKWLENGWVDYFVPQLYWAIEAREQSFPVLLKWWDEQNPQKRHIWPGLDTTKVRGDVANLDTPNRQWRSDRPRTTWQPQEIAAQIRLASQQPVSAGHVHWNMKSIMRSPAMQSSLQLGGYAEPALVPTCKWLDSKSPAKPQLTATPVSSSVKLSWDTASTDKISNYVLQYRRNGKWTTQILAGDRNSLTLDGALPDAIALTAVDRVGNSSAAAARALRKQVASESGELEEESEEMVLEGL